jgi:hypothetical protein
VQAVAVAVVLELVARGRLTWQVDR